MELKASEIKRMKKEALSASRNAYCPYSNFRVGAAVLASNGEIFSGCNVENISFGLTICAERSAIFQAIAKGQNNIRAVVIVTHTDNPTQPCGACRQVIQEFGKESEIISFGNKGKTSRWSLRQLLPEAFEPESSGDRNRR